MGSDAVAFASAIATLLILAGLVVALSHEMRLSMTPRVRMLARSALGVGVLLCVGAFWFIGHEMEELGWISGTTATVVVEWFGLAMAIAGVMVGMSYLRRLFDREMTLRQAERLVAILDRRVGRLPAVAALALTAREVEVLALIAEGKLADHELAEELTLSPATAATHVRNIMRKAGVKRREDLLLLKPPG